MYPGQALLWVATCIEVTLNQETMPAVRLLRWQSEAELVPVPANRRLRRGEVRVPGRGYPG
jgi:hypothetical protein